VLAVRKRCGSLVLGLAVLAIRPPSAYAEEFDTSGAPEELPYKEGEKAPVGYHLEAGGRAGAVASGVALLGLSYGTVVVIGAADRFENKKGFFLVPVLGPALWFSSRSYQHDGDVAGGLLIVGGVFDLVLQAAGTGSVLRECVNPPKRFVRDVAERRFITPVVARGFVGFSFAGEL
jgi:hypothetical protein